MKMGKTELIEGMIEMYEEELRVEVDRHAFLTHVLDLNIMDDFEEVTDEVMEMRDEVCRRMVVLVNAICELDEGLEN